jgi:hypothetical protein
VVDERVALVFENVPVAHVQEIYRGFLTQCTDAVALATKFPHRTVEKYDRYLSDDLTALLFACERLDLSGALEKIRRSEFYCATTQYGSRWPTSERRSQNSG